MITITTTENLPTPTSNFFPTSWKQPHCASFLQGSYMGHPSHSSTTSHASTLYVNKNNQRTNGPCIQPCFKNTTTLPCFSQEAILSQVDSLLLIVNHRIKAYLNMKALSHTNFHQSTSPFLVLMPSQAE